MQRRRLVGAAFEVVFERGAQALTAGLVCQRAGMSRKTFYDLFEDREDCLLAAFEEAVGQATQAVQAAVAGWERWVDMVRAGLVGSLAFLDGEPAMGRLLVVESLASGEQTVDARQRTIAQLIAIVDRGRDRSKNESEPPPLTAEGVVGAVISVIQTRMLKHEQRALVELAGELMAIVVGPYFGPAAARRELDRPNANMTRPTPRLPSDPFKDLPMRLTYRTARALVSIGATPGASSRQVAEDAGIADQGQASKLLHRLERYGLIQDTGVGPTKGMARAWSLTTHGEQILQAVGQE
ncbi:MAG: TetR/AcrR family transcriptional regulator [Solirubrobacteraceae bacterium]